VAVLLASGATVNIRNKMTGKTPLHYAAESRRFGICEMLLEHGASKRTRDRNGLKPLYYGSEVQEEESLLKARLLRDAPGRIMYVAPRGPTPTNSSLRTRHQPRAAIQLFFAHAPQLALPRRNSLFRAATRSSAPQLEIPRRNSLFRAATRSSAPQLALPGRNSLFRAATRSSGP
jgi:hypothetical protein